MKKTVERMCRGCRALKNREEMFKITKVDGELFLNPDSKTTGRSVYVCKNDACIKTFIKSKGIKRGLKFNNDSKIQELEAELLKTFSESNLA